MLSGTCALKKKKTDSIGEHHVDGPWTAETTLSGKFLSILDRVLLISGAILLIVYGAALIDRHVSSRFALRNLQNIQAEPERATGENDEPVDFKLWSEKRVKEHQRSLLVKRDSPIAALRIEKLNIRVPVFQNTDDLSLNRGVGWIAGTARPGESGNVGIAGHRDGFFRGLKDIAVGDLIDLASISGPSVYAVDQIEIVAPENAGVLRPRSQPSLTLVTCFPFYFVGSAPRRFIVHAVLKQPTAAERIPGQFTLTLPSQLETKEKGR